MNDKVKKSEPVPATPNTAKVILIVVIVCIVIGLVFVTRPKHKTINLSNLSSKELKQRTTPAQPAVASEPADDDGIISFEMYPNPKKATAATAQGTSREAVVRMVQEAVSGIEDDLTAKNAVISQISRLNFKLTGAELLSILDQAGIRDEFYFSSTVKSVAPSLQYPLTEAEFAGIIARVTDVGYEYKVRNALRREQERHAQQ